MSYQGPPEEIRNLVPWTFRLVFYLNLPTVLPSLRAHLLICSVGLRPPRSHPHLVGRRESEKQRPPLQYYIPCRIMRELGCSGPCRVIRFLVYPGSGYSRANSRVHLDLGLELAIARIHKETDYPTGARGYSSLASALPVVLGVLPPRAPTGSVGTSLSMKDPPGLFLGCSRPPGPLQSSQQVPPV